MIKPTFPVQTTPNFSALWLRVAAIVPAVLVLLMPIEWFAKTGVIVIMLIAGGAASTALGGIAVAAVGLALVAHPTHPLATALAILAGHLIMVLTSLVGVVPVKAFVTIAALRPTAIRFVLVQIVSQAVGLFTMVVPRLRPEPGIAIAAVVGALACVGAVVAILAIRTHALRGERTPELGHERPNVGGPT